MPAGSLGRQPAVSKYKFRVMKPKKISVVVPIYNVEAFLPQCLDSLYAQKGVLLEPILVNDGATDGSPALCRDYQRRHPGTLVIDKENGGLSDARNAGLAHATGDYVFFLDADDWMAPDALASLLAFAEAEHCDVVQGAFYYAWTDHLLLDDRYTHGKPDTFTLSRDEAMRELVSNQYVKNFAWGKLLRTDIARRHPFRKGAWFEDSFWMHHIIEEAQRYGVVNRPLYYYRQREQGISGTFSVRNLDLLRGNEERLRFIQSRHPDLLPDMADFYWRLCRQMHALADARGGEVARAFDAYCAKADAEYRPLFNEVLGCRTDYRLATRHPEIAKAVGFARRVYNHFFGKRLKRIDLHSSECQQNTHEKND